MDSFHFHHSIEARVKDWNGFDIAGRVATERVGKELFISGVFTRYCSSTATFH